MAEQIKLYHVTEKANVESIVNHGLKGGTNARNRSNKPDKPSIYVLISDDIGLCERVAIDQIWPHDDIEEYAVIGIDLEGISGPIEFDHVDESTAVYQRVIVQDWIAPQFLRLLLVRPFAFPGKRLSEIVNAIAERQLTTEEWELANKYYPGRWPKPKGTSD